MASRVPKSSPSPDSDDWIADVDQERLSVWIQEALDDPRPSISQEQVFADLKAHIAQRRAQAR